MLKLILALVIIKALSTVYVALRGAAEISIPDMLRGE